MYRYWIDVHGQLFLYDTVPKNLTSCFKSVPFLNFFYARIERVPGTPLARAALRLPPHDAPHWTESRDELAAILSGPGGRSALQERLHAEGFAWQSKCQGELNVIHAVDTPVVFRSLSEDGVLSWAGDYTLPFQPNKLLVNPCVSC